MWVTLVGGKILYGKDSAALVGYFANSEGKVGRSATAAAAQASVADASGGTRWDAVKARVLKSDSSDCVQLSPAQFLRFKMAGRQEGQGAAKTYHDVDPLTGGTPTTITIQRAARTGSAVPLGKWDVASYGDLTGRAGPWGSGARTNRDHLLAHSTNLIRWKSGHDDYGASTESQLKREGLAVVISGDHHRQGSSTYGGRAHYVNAAHATNPQAGVKAEIDTLLGWKAGKSVTLGSGVHTKPGKATLRIEMVGAYFYLYKRLVEQKIIAGEEGMDTMLLSYLRAAVADDDGFWRIDPEHLEITTATANTGGGSTTTRWKVP